MKKQFTLKRPLRTALILIAAVTAAAAAAAVAADVIKKSDPVPDGDDYGAYIDTAKNKVLEKTAEIQGERVQLTYARTENLKEQRVSKRADCYGTYDVYTDSSENEYLYLFNSDLYCGYKQAAPVMPAYKADAVPEEQALKTAESFLKSLRSNGSDYELSSCVYDELAGYYDIEYALPVSGRKTDDIFRVWVDSKGQIASFSEFNYQRYDNLRVTEKQYAKAEEKLRKKIAAETDGAEYTVADTYLSVSDKGKTVLVMAVEYKIPVGNGMTTEREEFSQPL